MDKPLLSPTNDYVVKRLLTDDPDALRDFVQAVRPLPEEEWRHFSIVDPAFRAHKEHDKLPILDIKVQTASGIQIDIEAQRRWHKYFEERMVYYTARMFVDKLSRTGSYGDLRLSISIVIADFVLEKKDRLFHHKHSLYDSHARISYPVPSLELHTLEIPKRKKDDLSPLGLWMHFFAARTEEEFMQLAQRSPVMEKNWTIIKELSADEEARLLAEAREKYRMDCQAFYETGFDAGEARRNRAIAAKMLQIGLPLNQIVQCTGLSSAEVQKLQTPSSQRRDT